MTKRKQTQYPEEDIQLLEATLAGALKPVAPSKEIFKRLDKRIQMPSREKIVSRLSDWNKLFLVFAGVISGMLLIITAARALYFLAGRRV